MKKANTASINSRILDLWEQQFSSDADVLMPLLYSPLKINSLVFVGLNPSFNIPGLQRMIKNTPHSNIDPENYYHWRNRNQFNEEIDFEISSYIVENYPYFNKFKDIANYANIDWEHLDMFFYRMTKQNQFKSIIMNGHSFNEFGKEQLKIFKSLVTLISPKIIVVANAFASRTFCDYFNPYFDEAYGCHFFDNDGRMTPVFLSSMVTGQRALDIFSFQRLKWHIKQVLDSPKNS